MPVSGTISSAMQLEASRVDILAHNLANASTPGFKRVLLLEDARGPRTAPDMSSGPLQDSGKTFDLALQGPGFFVLDAPGRGQLLTRRGQFHLDNAGYLVSAEGYRVLGEQGPLQISSGEGAVEVRADGSLVRQGQSLGRLQRMQPPPDVSLAGLGDSTFTVPDGTTLVAAGGTVRQGALEGSNVDALQEMTAFMESVRFFEMGQKVLQTAEAVNKKLTDDVGHSR